MSNLPRSKRKPAAVSFRLVERDMTILRALARYKYLRTSQIKRLVFAENSSIQSARRRLKYLYHHGFAGRIEALVQSGHGVGETAYFLDRKGRALLEDEFDFAGGSKKQNQVKPQYLAHALDVAEFQLTLDLALAESDAIALKRFVADHELKGCAAKAVGRQRYKLFDQVTHPVSKKSFTVYPDALVILQGIGKLKAYSQLYFVEVDRGTEGLRIIRDKLTGYRLYAEQGIFKKFGKFADFKVLIQTTSEKRKHNIHEAVSNMIGGERVWVTCQTQVTPQSLLRESIWLDHRGESRSVIRPAAQATVSA